MIVETAQQWKEQLKAMTRDELVDVFERLSLVQGDAYANFQTARTNRLFQRLREVKFEMRHREADERPALFVLYSHRHPQVRYNVAHATYALDPTRAESALSEIAASRMFPWAGAAGMSLWALANGTSRLPFDPE